MTLAPNTRVILKEPMVVEMTFGLTGDSPIVRTTRGSWHEEHDLITVTAAPPVELWGVFDENGKFQGGYTSAEWAGVELGRIIGSSGFTVRPLIAFERK